MGTSQGISNSECKKEILIFRAQHPTNDADTQASGRGSRSGQNQALDRLRCRGQGHTNHLDSLNSHSRGSTKGQAVLAQSLPHCQDRTCVKGNKHSDSIIILSSSIRMVMVHGLMMPYDVLRSWHGRTQLAPSGFGPSTVR